MRAGAVLAGLTCALVPVFATPEAVAPAGEAAKPAEKQSSASEAELLAANAALVRYRDGDDTALSELRAAAERCARLYGRVDCPEIVDFFSKISNSDRRAGWETEKDFSRIFTEVSRA